MTRIKLPSGLPATRQLTRSALVALLCYAYFLIATVALYFSNSEYTLARSFTAIGNYDLGPHEFLIASTIFSLGLGSLALVSGLYHGISPSARSRIGLVLLVSWGVGMLIAGIFPTDKPGSTVPHMTTVLIAGVFPVAVEAYPETTFGWVHVLAGFLSFLSLALAAVSLSWRFKLDEKWRPFHRLALSLSLVMLGTLIWIFLVVFFVFRTGFEAIILNILIGASLMWLFLTSIQLRFKVLSDP